MGMIKEGCLQIASGGCAGTAKASWLWCNVIYIEIQICSGFVEVCIMHPLDLIKTRFQVQRGPDDPNRYKGLIDCFVKIYKSEG